MSNFYIKRIWRANISLFLLINLILEKNYARMRPGEKILSL